MAQTSGNGLKSKRGISCLSRIPHIVTFTNDHASGSLTSTTDQNSQPTSYIYGDLLGRLTEIDYPVGKTLYDYGGHACGPVTISTLLSGTSNDYVQANTLDGLCRVIQTAHSDPAGSSCTALITGGADCTDTTYDGMGRVWKVSNPYRTTTESTYGLTITTYDTAGRVSDQGTTKSIQYPDGNTTSTTYSSNSTIITDPQGKSRTLVSEDLGRLASVQEPGSFTTSYKYDPLNNLLSVVQGSQLPGCTSGGTSVSRSFAYDSLSQLTSACNPESGTTSYTYDPNGNVKTKADARGKTVCYGNWTGSSCDAS